jgi:hypothetical protein
MKSHKQVLYKKKERIFEKLNDRYLEIPPVKQPLGELIRRQQAGRPLEDVEPTLILERKQGHWPGRLIVQSKFLFIYWTRFDFT